MTTLAGYWTEKRMQIWSHMTPAERDHDRYVGVYPPGDSAYETEGAREAAVTQADEMYDDATCTCHINPPCTFCTSQPG
jgi:hypothetical protein